MRISVTRQMLIALFVAALAGCTAPNARVHELATSNAFQRSEISGADFVHVIYHRAVSATADRIHVYIEHDGLPWATATRVSEDPTPRDPLVLRLAVQDKASVIYLGRPCYFGMARVAPCTPLMWTHERYSEQVINSMATALRSMLGERRFELVFVGHSGGGTLAWLLAQRFPTTRAVVTIAGNLDVRAWAAWHGYTPLLHSLSPADSPNLLPRVLQMHLVGGRDTVVPSSLVRQFVSHRAEAVLLEYPTFDHRCCWDRIWPAVLGDIEGRITQPPFVEASGDR